MSLLPLFQLFVGNQPIDPTQSEWHRPLPGGLDVGRSNRGDTICCGPYLQAVERFLKAGNAARLRQALDIDRIDSVHIHLEKHGAFYHPCRVEVNSGGDCHQLVVNGAVHPTGQRIIEGEFAALQRAYRLQDNPSTPAVYALGREQSGSGQPVMLFLAQWFSGYHEFHLSSKSGHRMEMVLWDPAGPRILTASQRACLYRQAAHILTTLYQPATAEQVHGWHHGAGDFVAMPVADMLALKLISVRGFAAVFDAATLHNATAGLLTEALVLFLISMSFRLRLDRLDGTGQLALAGSQTLVPCLEGFFSALDVKTEDAAFPAPPGMCLRVVLSQRQPQDLVQAASVLPSAWPANAPERELLATHLPDHVSQLTDCLFQGGFLQRYPWT